MSDPLIRVAVYLISSGLLYWLWRRIFRGGGITILAFAWIAVALISIFSLSASKIVLWISFLVTIIFEVWRIISAPQYSKANAVFETNQILRGLSPAEAAYFIGLKGRDVFVVAVLNLLDKGMLKLDNSSADFALSLDEDYLPGNSSMSPGERTSYRSSAAKRKNQIIHPYEDVLLELVSAKGGIPAAGINSSIWNKFLSNELSKLTGVYDFSETADYALKIVEKMTLPDSAFAAGKRNLSGWKAIPILNNGENSFNKHRPEWLAPDDDFQSVVNKIRILANVRP